MSFRTLGVVIGLLVIAPVHAATNINETRPLERDGRVRIENIKGQVTVRTWAQPQVRITGSLGRGAEKLLIEGDARSLDIEVKYPNSGGSKLWGGGDRSRQEPTVLEVMIPQRASLDVDTVSANIDVQQMAGRRLSASSVSGAVLVTASSPGEARFENVSGDITLRITTSGVRIDSVSGDVRLQGGLTGEVHVESVSGNIDVTSRALDSLQVNTVSGDARLQAALKPGGAISAETLSGTIDLRLPRDTNAKLRAESFSGDIRSPAGKIAREEYGPGKSLDASLGTGQGRIDLESFSGDLRLQLE